MALGLALIAAALAFAVIGNQTHALPDVVVGVLFYGLGLSGCVLVVQGWRARYGRGGIRPLKPGEAYDTTVKLATLPNVPLADLWRQRLKEHGIESFYKGGSPLANVYGTQLDAVLPAELWVGEHDLHRARELFPELASRS